MDDIDYNDPYIKECVELFDKRQSCAKWFWLCGEDGSFEVLNRKELLELYINSRCKGQDGEPYIIMYREAATFSEAKNEVISWLQDWNNEIRLSLRQAKAIKKGSRK